MHPLLLGMVCLSSWAWAEESLRLAPDNDVRPDLRTRNSGSDWPTFLGPTQDSVSTEVGIRTRWPQTGLKIVWQAELGLGYPAPVTSRGRLFQFHRIDDTNALTCRKAETGTLLWEFRYPTDYEDLYGYEPGPRACPVVDDDRVYIYGPEGMLYCLNVTTGRPLWKVDTRKQYRFHQNFFGVGSVPVVEGELLIVAVGGSPIGPRPMDLRQAKGNGTAIVAFDKRTGVEKYRVGDELASYASPTIATINGRRLGVYFARGGLFTFDPASGKAVFSYPWRARIEESVNAANPTIVGDRIYLSECYGPGTVCLRVKGDTPEVVWSDVEKDRFEKSLQCHWNTPIHHDGYLYGCSGRHSDGAEFRCIDAMTGKVMWKKRGFTRTSFLKVDGHLLGLAEDGILVLVKLNPQGYEQIASWEIPELDGPCWAAPVLSHGLLYLRGAKKLLCVELIPGK